MVLQGIRLSDVRSLSILRGLKQVALDEIPEAVSFPPRAGGDATAVGISAESRIRLQCFHAYVRYTCDIN